jgi:hypothetical protein
VLHSQSVARSLLESNHGSDEGYNRSYRGDGSGSENKDWNSPKATNVRSYRGDDGSGSENKDWFNEPLNSPKATNVSPPSSTRLYIIAILIGS